MTKVLLILLCGEESEADLRARIGDLAYEITQNAATGYAFTGEYDDFFEKGLYVDTVSGEPLSVLQWCRSVSGSLFSGV